MDNVKAKYYQMVQMLQTLKIAVSAYNEPTVFTSPLRYEAYIIVALRSSVIQSLGYCVDHLWKYTKIYLEQEASLIIQKSLPADVIRYAIQSGIINVEEGEKILEMIKVRNKTSHIYKEEIADFTAKQAHGYCQLIEQVLAKMKPNE